MEGKVWIKPHKRNGKEVSGYWRKTSGRSSSATRGGGDAPTQIVKPNAKLNPNKKMEAEDFLTPAQIAKAKLTGTALHSSGKVIYYDGTRKDFYVTTGYANGKDASSLRANGGIVENANTGSQRVYFKKNKKSTFDALMT